METDSTFCFKLLISPILWGCFPDNSSWQSDSLSTFIKASLKSDTITLVLLSTFGIQSGFYALIRLKDEMSIFFSDCREMSWNLTF